MFRIPVAGERADIGRVKLGAAVHVRCGRPGDGQRTPVPAHIAVRDPNPAPTKYLHM
jgi:hypothetical protein